MLAHTRPVTGSPARHPVLALGLVGSLLLGAASSLGAQYPLVPSPVLDIRKLTQTPTLSGYLSLRQTQRNDSASFVLNRGRLTVMAAPRSFVAVRLQGDLSAAVSGRLRSDSTTNGFTLTDAYVQLSPPDSTAVTPWHPALILGQFKQPFSLEYLTSFAYLQTANRSQVVDRLSPRRDIGVMGQLGWSRYVTVAASVTNGEGPNMTSNPNGKELVMGRLTLSPLRGLAIAGKLANEATTHIRGYDARWMWRNLIVEGEAIHRSGPVSATSTTTFDAGGGYVLASYRLLPWLQPVYKWERYTERRAGAAETRSTWNTLGLNLLTRQESLRVQLDWVLKSERPTSIPNNEFIVQVIGNY